VSPRTIVYPSRASCREEELEFVRGDGSGQPLGILNATTHEPLTEETLRAAINAVSSQVNPSPTHNQEVEVSVTPVVTKKSWLPTRKWVAAQVVALGAVAVSWIESGWDATEEKLLIGIVVQALTTYLISNQDTPGGVPVQPDPSL
jgi:hypothetical protein